MLRELIKIANDLDNRGLVKEADVLDNIIKTAIIDLPMWGEAQRVYSAALQAGGRSGAMTALNGYFNTFPKSLMTEPLKAAYRTVIREVIHNGARMLPAKHLARQAFLRAGGSATSSVLSGLAGDAGAAATLSGATTIGGAMTTGGAAAAGGLIALSGALVAWMGYEGYQAAVQSLDIKNENTIKAANNAVATAFISALKRIRTSGEISDDEKRRRLSVSAQIQRNQSITDNEMFQKMMKEVTPEEWAMAKDAIKDSPLSSSGGSGVEGEKARALFEMFQNNTPPSTPVTDAVGVKDLWEG